MSERTIVSPSQHRPMLPPQRPASNRPGRRSHQVFWVVAVIVLAFLAAWKTDLVPAISVISSASAVNYQTHTVQRGPLQVTVTEEGNVESASNVDIKCLVQGGSTILEIVPDGEQVAQGTLLVRLDSSTIEEQLTEQQIALSRANAALIKAQEDVEVAKISVREYEEGTFLKDKQIAEGNIVIAEENLKSAQNMLEHSEKMLRKGYINQLQLQSDRFGVEHAHLELNAQKTAMDVLVRFTKPKTLKELSSTLEAAKANLQAEQAATNLEETKLKRLTKQLEHCTIKATQDGMVIYANNASSTYGGSGARIEEGAQVREFQTIILLPDLTQMQVKVLVHETKIDKVRTGMTATVKIRDWKTTGTVDRVGSQPEPHSWFNVSVKKYAVIVKLDESIEGDIIKPGMTAEVEVLALDLEDVSSVPLQGVVELGDGKFFCFVKDSKQEAGYEKRPVVIGVSNDSFIQIKDGLNSGDQVILNPRSTIPEARKPAQRRTPEEETGRDGESSQEVSEKSADGS